MQDRKRVWWLGRECEYAIRDQCGERVCMWNEDAPGCCELEVCPMRGGGGNLDDLDDLDVFLLDK